LYEKWFGTYEEEVGLQAVKKYIMPIVLIVLSFAGYVFYRRQVKRTEGEVKNRDLYDHAPDMLLSIETKSEAVIDCNQTLLDVTGYTREEIIGRSMYEIYHQDCTTQVRIAFLTCMTSKEVHGVVLQLKRKDGSNINVSMNASAVCDKISVALQCRTALRVSWS
jgi:PAS domain S-box-containing protein